MDQETRENWQKIKTFIEEDENKNMLTSAYYHRAKVIAEGGEDPFDPEDANTVVNLKNFQTESIKKNAIKKE